MFCGFCSLHCKESKKLKIGYKNKKNNIRQRIKQKPVRTTASEAHPRSQRFGENVSLYETRVKVRPLKQLLSLKKERSARCFQFLDLVDDAGVRMSYVVWYIYTERRVYRHRPIRDPRFFGSLRKSLSLQRVEA